jgi:hypothetical protein
MRVVIHGRATPSEAVTGRVPFESPGDATRPIGVKEAL